MYSGKLDVGQGKDCPDLGILRAANWQGQGSLASFWRSARLCSRWEPSSASASDVASAVSALLTATASTWSIASKGWRWQS